MDEVTLTEWNNAREREVALIVLEWNAQDIEGRKAIARELTTLRACKVKMKEVSDLAYKVKLDTATWEELPSSLKALFQALFL